MGESTNLLMLEFLTWVADRRRTYDEAMEAWQSHCPRQTIWEDAIIDGYIQVNGGESLPDPEVILTARGKAILNGTNGDPIMPNDS
jgi:hypothetical protein